MTNTEILAFIEASLERDLADLNMDSLTCALALESPSIAHAIRLVAPEIYRSGYLAGARTGMEVGQVILKEEMPK